MPRKPKLIPGCEERQVFRNPEKATEKRWSAPLAYAAALVADTAERVRQSAELFPWKFYRGCCHSHTQHSDGIGTVAETAEMVRKSGLDFQFVTDHWGVTQGPECRRHKLWIGQEPPTQHHHLGILGLDHAFAPEQDLRKDFAEVKRLGGTPFIPHPAGWFPKKVYTEEQKDSLDTLPDPFLMEIVNGANNIGSAFDYTDDLAMELWEKLLVSGRRVHAMGNTDAHSPHAIGMVWNLVFAAKPDQASILRALNAGRMTVSDGPLLHISAGRIRMGGTLRNRNGSTRLRVDAADGRGLATIRLVGDGREVVAWHFGDTGSFSHEAAIPSGLRRYIRAEAWARDGRRAFSNPIYLSPDT